MELPVLQEEAPKKKSKKPDVDYEQVLVDQLVSLGAPIPERQLVFHPKRKWRFDLSWTALMIAVEVEGAVWAGGRHTRGGGYEGDCEKYNEAQRLGWRVYRFSTGMVSRNVAGNFLAGIFGLEPPAIIPKRKRKKSKTTKGKGEKQDVHTGANHQRARRRTADLPGTGSK